MNQEDFKKLYNDVIGSQERARKGLLEAMVLEPLPMYTLKKKVGVDSRTLERFLEGRDLRFPQLVRVCKYIIEVEERNGIKRTTT